MEKWLFISHSAILDGGAELSLLEILKECQKKELEIHVLLPSKEGGFSEELDYLEIPYTIMPMYWQFLGKQTPTQEEINGIYSINEDILLRALQFLKEYQPDKVISNTIVNNWYSIMASKLGIPVVTMIREIVDVAGFLNKEGKAMPNREYLIRTVNEATDFFVYNSKYVQSFYEKDFGKTESALYYPPVKIKPITGENEEAKDVFQKIRILFAGRIDRNKNPFELVKALPYISGEIESVDFYGTTSDPDYLEEINQFIQEKNLENVVTFHGFERNIYEKIAEATILVVTSQEEPFGRVTLEGQLLGKIVVGADAAGTSELIEEGKTGFLYELGNPKHLAEKIDFILSHPEKMKNISENTPNIQYQKYVVENSFETIYEKINALPKKENRFKTAQGAFSIEEVLIGLANRIEKECAYFLQKFNEQVQSNLDLNAILLQQIDEKESLKLKYRRPIHYYDKLSQSKVYAVLKYVKQKIKK